MVPPSSNGIPRAPLYSFLIDTVRLQGFHLSRQPSQIVQLLYSTSHGLFRFRSPLLTESLPISFPLGTKMFQFPRFASRGYITSPRDTAYSGGFPHSDIDGSLVVHTSSPLFAVYHVFLRLLVSRHPPVALSRLENMHSDEYSLLSYRFNEPSICDSIPYTTLRQSLF